MPKPSINLGLVALANTCIWAVLSYEQTSIVSELFSTAGGDRADLLRYLIVPYGGLLFALILGLWVAWRKSVLASLVSGLSALLGLFFLLVVNASNAG